MKICPECQAGNTDEAVLCRECSAFLGKVAIQEEEALLQAEMEKYERRQRRNRCMIYAALIGMSVLDVAFLIIAILRGTAAFSMVWLMLTPLAGYASVFHADKLFKLDFFLDIDNVAEARPSEWYYFKKTFGGIWATVVGTVCMGMIALS